MTDRRFRLLLLSYVVVTLAAGTAAFVPGINVSQELAAAYAHEPEPWIARNLWLSIGLAVPLLVAIIAGLVGMFFFKRWGRTLSLYTTLIGLPLYLLSGPTLSSALEGTLYEASTLIWGAILALAYYSPIASRLGANNSFKPKPLRGSA